jgi:hypothetical protein
MGVEPMTCRLRIGCSTSKLRWRSEEPDNSAGGPLRQMGPEGIALENQECLNGKPAKSRFLIEFWASEHCFSLALALTLRH